MAITIVMIIGAVFIGIFSLPNLIYVLKTKNTVGVNLYMYLIFVFSCTCFAIYGGGMTFDNNLSGGLPTMISNIFCVTIACITLVYKFKNMKKAKQNNMTELQY
jgi:uncharacterized protein with PQ loop repeat